MCLMNQKCKVYADRILSAEPLAIANKVYSMFDMEVPVAIPRRNVE